MNQVIAFPRERRFSQETRQLKDLSDQIDAIVMQAIDEGIPIYEIAGLLSHRLGTLMRNVEEKDRLWDVCSEVLKKQASL